MFHLLPSYFITPFQSHYQELVRDLIAIVTVFSARLHGLRSHKNLIRAAALGKDISDDQGTQNQTASHA